MTTVARIDPEPAGGPPDAELLAALAEVARDAVPRDPDAVRAFRDGPDGFDRALWKRFGDLGWLSLLVPEGLGGAGAGEDTTTVIARALGAAGRLEPFVAGGVIVPLWLAGVAGAARPARELLGAVTAGALVAVPAWQGPDGDPEPAELPVVAERAGDGVVLHGTAHWVPHDRPDVFVVAARAGAETLLVRVDAGMGGATVHRQPMADGTAWARLELRGVQLPAPAVLGRGAAAAHAVAAGVDAGVVLVAAELAGTIERMLALTVEYLGRRRQFGRPIGTFQSLQHRAVDLWVQQQLTEAALTDALRRRRGAGPEACARAASGAKARASSAALLIGGQAVQLHGAIGFTDEYELSRHVNRALVLAAWLGNARFHTRRYGRLTAAS